MADEVLLDKVHGLSDLELAVLLCLINREHVLLSTPPDAVEDLVQELQLVARKTFGLKWVIVHCDPNTTLEDFVSALNFSQQSSNPPTSSISPFSRGDSYFAPHSSSSNHHRPSLATLGPLTPIPLAPQIANFVIAKNLDRAPRVVQIQALELLRTRRVFTHTSVQAAPKQFVFVPLVAAESGGEAHVTPHLNEFFAIAHWHNPDDGYVNLDEVDGGDDDETASTGSVVKKSSNSDGSPTSALISEIDISHLAKLTQRVSIDVDVLRYQMNIISFLRMHRAVATGMTPTATKHFHQLVKSLAPLHKLDFVTPALVALATRKVYLHRIRITTPENERSMQWGSRLPAIEALLEDMGPEEVIEEVLEAVTAPL